jgi:DoxX-like family
MFVAYVAVTVFAAAGYAYAAFADFTRPRWVVFRMSRLRVPESWMIPLGVLKGAGALGLLVGIGIPLIGVAAAVGLVLFFIGAITTALRARWYAHIPEPAAFLLPAAASLVLRLTAS